jgi:outer membrane lipoprotein SlyB
MRFAFATSALAGLVLLAGCAVSPPDDTVAFRPGTGVVEGMQPARVALPRGSTQGYEITLRMDDGSTQRVSQDSAAFKFGDRVQVTPEGRVVRIAAVPTPAPAATSAPVARNYRPGMGIVESATVVALSSSSSSAAAAGGASGPTMAYRLKMLDGTTQSVVQTGPRFEAGERVEVTKEGRVIRP